MAKKLIIALGVAAITLTSAACNTVKGIGRDIESVGEAGDQAV
jgi:predicted small secreted protein